MKTQQHRIGIEFISLFNILPIDMVKIAADLGCQHISIALEPMHTKHIAYPAWSLRDDKAMRRDLLQALNDSDISISMGECFMIRPGADIRDSAQADLEIMRELNIPRINIVSIDGDFTRSVDQCGAVVEMAQALGMQSTLEFIPQVGFENVHNALRAVEQIDNPSFSLVIDAMHFFRSGATLTDFKNIESNRIGYVQLCDVPEVSKYEQYMYEARYERLPPGEGDLPLREFLAAAPRDVVVGLEIPMLASAQSEAGVVDRLRKAVMTTRELLADLN